VKLLPKALLFVLLVGLPAVAQQSSFDDFRDMWFGPLRGKLFNSCAMGMKLNSIGKSYWNPDNISELKVEYLKIIQGENIDKLDLMLSSQAAAMKAACPSIN